MEGPRVRVLLVEDDEDDQVIVRDVLSEIKDWKVHMDWVSGHAEALEKIKQEDYDICLMDYRLGERDGIELLREFILNGFRAPIIFLTGAGSHEIDVRAMHEGAADYLEKSDLNPNLLERCIRYAIERSRTLEALRESENQIRLVSTKILEAQENERKIVAQELHDSIGSTLAAIKYALEEKRDTMGTKDPAPYGIPLDQVIAMVRDAIEETQRISSNLRPSILDDLGIIRTIGWSCRKFQDVYTGIQLEKQLYVQEDDVPESLKIIIYRIIQEALNNVSKHSRADTVRLSLKKEKDGVELSVEDNGQGFDMEDMLSSDGHTGGMGIQGMKERVMLSNGTLEVVSGKGKGTIVRALWPID
jgi:signal transduction histidine kinase